MSDDPMKDYLVLKLHGVLQAWGGHTFEDYRPTELMPTRSGILGLLGACLGLDRQNLNAHQALSKSIKIAVRSDKRHLKTQRINDFHTVEKARKSDGKVNKNPVVSRREYLCDAVFTLLLEQQKEAAYSIEILAKAVKNPIYTPFLGRRACSLNRPLYEDQIKALDFKNAFALLDQTGGLVYSDKPLATTDQATRLRDEPQYLKTRQFATRTLYIHRLAEVSDVSQ